MWILLALLTPTIHAVVNIVDKMILDRHSPSVIAFCFWFGVCELFFGSVVIGIVSLWGLDVRAALGGVLTGGVMATALMVYLPALKRGQVARLIPLRFIWPLMVAPMAAGFLGEEVSPLAAVAIVLAVMGGMLVSWEGARGSRSFGSVSALFLVVTSAVIQAVSVVLAKYFLDDGDFWSFYGGNRAGFAPPVLLMVLAQPQVRRAIPGLIRRRGFIGLISVDEAAATLAQMTRFSAIKLGPVSLVSALGSMQPLVVFLYVLTLATAFPSSFGGWISRRNIVTQAAGVCSIVAAVAIISLQ